MVFYSIYRDHLLRFSSQALSSEGGMFRLVNSLAGFELNSAVLEIEFAIGMLSFLNIICYG